MKRSSYQLKQMSQNEYLFNVGGIEQNGVLLLRTKFWFKLLLATRAHIVETDLLDLPYRNLPTILSFVVSQEE